MAFCRSTAARRIAALALLGFSVWAETPPPFLSVADFGAKGDSQTDDTEAFQRALDAAAPQGRWVLVPPLGGGCGYVLTRTVTVPESVVLTGAPWGFGCNVRAVFDLPETHVTGAKILARPETSQYDGMRKAPLFELKPGCTVRGLWILYDQQPLPSDAEFQEAASPYHYESFAAARQRFVSEHAKTYGPTFYSSFAGNVVVEDIICDRYYDFLYFETSGKCHFNRITMHGYRRGFVFERAPDVLHVTNVEYVPNVGPTSPGGPFANGRTYTWVYGVIASQEDNVGLWLGQVDGYSFTDLAFFGIHTGIRFGCSDRYPLQDTVQGRTVRSLAPGTGPWGDCSGLKIDQCAVGLHFVWPTHLTNRVSNLLIFTGFNDGTQFVGRTGVTGKQAAFLVEDSHSRENNAGALSSFMAANTLVASFNDAARFGPASANGVDANGQVFQVNGDILMNLANVQVNPPYTPERVCAFGVEAREAQVSLRGVVLQFKPAADLRFDVPGESR